MGIEFFLLILLGIIAVGAGMFFSGSFGVAKAGAGRGRGKRRPTHAYVENETNEKLFGMDSSEQVRGRAEDDPNTEVRA
jgi:hypothetical protein